MHQQSHALGHTLGRETNPSRSNLAKTRDRDQLH
jgi:hypothetical protein